MTKIKSAQQVFDEWSRIGEGDGMEKSHWPRVSQVLTRIPPGKGNYLEIGIGNGYALEYMATNPFSHGHCYGLDVSCEMVKASRQRVAHLQNVTVDEGDFLQWQPPAIRFDVIFSMEVFYYFPDIQAGIDKAVDLLSPGGQLFVMVDFYQENPESHDWPEMMGTPMTLWSKSDYHEGFTKAELTDVRQELVSGGSSHHGLTLCTRGRKR